MGTTTVINSDNKNRWQYIISGLFLLVISLTMIFFLFNNYIYQQKQIYPDPSEPIRMSLKGEYVCLPLRSGETEPARDCIPGLKTATGDHYAVDFLLMSATPVEIEPGQFFKANGLVIPPEKIVNEDLQEYAITGLFSITDSVEVITRVEAGWSQ